jgi:hypothetical protein
MPNAQEYASRRERFLKENFPKFMKELREEGELKSYLQKLGQQAKEMADAIEDSMISNVQKEKDLPFQEKLQRLQAIPQVVEEFVNHDLILAVPSAT